MNIPLYLDWGKNIMMEKIKKIYYSSIIIVLSIVISMINNIVISEKDTSFQEKIQSFNQCDMIIISPNKFSSALQPLIKHKNNVGIQTILKTTEEIYGEYEGRDSAEQVKYFIKDAIENFGVDYILLVGDVDLVPMRKSAVTIITWLSLWKGILTDLYYADIYDNNGNFCSWDSNNDGVFGEAYINKFRFINNFPIRKKDFPDEVDLYPDIGVGRLPCKNEEEVQIIIDKIIHYETETYEGKWFNNMVLMGGDTFPENDPDTIVEGELFLEEYIRPEMEKHGFNIIKLYTSLETFNVESINQEVTSGTGFVSYVGHGYPDRIGTYQAYNPSSFISYSIQDISGMNNGYKLPIFFVGACLTGKLDYNIFDKIISFDFPWCLLKLLTDKLETKKFPCFALSLIKKQDGGGIAAIAASQPGWEIYDGELGGTMFHRYFFEGYEPGINLSDMLIHAQNSYINWVMTRDGIMWDRNTIYEFNLIGDPSLKLGGYP